MSFFKKIAETTGGISYASSLSLSGPPDGTDFPVETGQNYVLATITGKSAVQNRVNLSFTGSLPNGIFYNVQTGVISGNVPLPPDQFIGSSSDDVYARNEGWNLPNTYGGSPSKTFSFSIKAEDVVPGIGIVDTKVRNYTLTLTVPFLYRQILTKGFSISGYRNSTVYNNVNSINHSTDTTTDLGGVLPRAFNYKGGTSGHSIHYMFGASNAHATTSNYTGAFNMRTNTNWGNRMNSNYNRQNASAMFQEWYWCWLSGSQTDLTEEFNLTTETRTSSNIGSQGNSSYSWSMSGETFAITYEPGFQRTFTYATRTFAGRSQTAPSNHSQQKSHQSKVGYAWAGGDGSYNGGYFFRKTNMVTNVLTSSNVGSKPHGNTGEENYDMGQDHGYACGTYNGAQNNLGWRWNFATDSGATNSNMYRKGIPGSSSGTGGWVD